MKQHLTERSIKAMVPEPDRDLLLYDDGVTGFAICIYRSGKRAFILRYRIAGRARHYTIGSWPDWSVTAAREEAKRLKREIDAGRDPLSMRIGDRHAPTISDAIGRYLKEHAVKLAPRSLCDQTSLLRKLIEPEWGTRKVTDITPDDVDRLLAKISKGRPRPRKHPPKNDPRRPIIKGRFRPTPVRANRVGEILRKMFNLAIRWQMRADNPASGFSRFPEMPRDRFLSADEIKRLAEVLAAHPNRRCANVIRLLLLTGARRGEAMNARWEQFDIENGIWTKPAATTKQRRLHRVPLSQAAVELRLPDAPPDRRCADANFHAASCAWADIDDDVVDEALERCRAAGALPNLIVVTGRHPHKRAQLWWRLAEPSRDPGKQKEVCAVLAEAVGGDPTVVNPGRVMRLGGTIAWPTKPGRRAELTEAEPPATVPPEDYRPTVLLDRLGRPDLLSSRLTRASEAQSRAPDESGDVAPAFPAQHTLAIGSLSVESALAAVRKGDHWHDHVVRLVAHWLSRGLSDVEILGMAGAITLPGWTMEQTRQDLAHMIGGARRKWNIPNPEHAIETALEPPPLMDEEEDGANAAMIPRRQWLIHGVASRGQLTVLVAPPGAGKSTFSIALGIAVVTGRDDITGIGIAQPTKVWIWNNEDDKAELRRRQNAVMLHANVDPADIRGRFAMNSGTDRPLLVASASRDGKVQRLPDIDALIDRIHQKGYGLMIVDPFVETHDVDENSNIQIKAVATFWRDVARKGNCAVILVHHTSKPPNANPNTFVASQYASRGASSLSGVARFVLTLFSMSKDDRNDACVNPNEQHLWVRLDGAKSNLTLVGGEPRWFKRTSITIANGEEVGILVPDDPAGSDDAQNRRERIRAVILREVTAAWNGWEKDRSRLPLSNEARVHKNRRIKDVVSRRAHCLPREAEVQAAAMIAAGDIVIVEFLHNKGTRHGLRPAAERPDV